MESERLVLYDPAIEPEAAGREAVPAAGMAGVEHRHVVFLSHGVYGVEQAQEVLLGIYVLLSVGAQQDVPAFLQAKPGVYI